MKTVLVTGASGGIGSAITKAIEVAGNHVIGIDHAHTDLSSHENIRKLEEEIVGSGMKLDWIVCAHGFIDNEMDIEKESLENIEKTFRINTLSVIYIVQLFLKHLNPEGGMIFLSSAAGLFPNGRIAVYSASKAAVNSFTQAIARNRPKFSFYSVCPGPTNTPMREKFANDAKTSQSPSVVAQIVEDIISGSKGYVSGDLILVRDGKSSIASRLT